MSITGVIDLPLGSHAITLEIFPGTIDGSVNIGSVTASVIEGQIVMQPECPGEENPCR